MARVPHSDQSAEGSPASESSRATGRSSAKGRGRTRGISRDLTKGSIPGNLWYLAWPQVAESFLSVVDQLADLVWAGRIGYQAIAGLGVAQTFLMMLMTARMGLDAGMRSMISRAVGARQIGYANHVMLQAITLTTAYSIVLVTVGFILTNPLLRLMGLGDEVVAQAGGYMRFQFFAMSVMGLQRLTAGALQASGDSMTPLKAATVSRVGHLVMSPFLIFGWWWFPSLELAGAGAANLIAQIVGAGMNMAALMRGTSRLKLSLRGYYVDFPLIWRLLKIGIPASVTGAQRAVSQLIVVFHSGSVRRRCSRGIRAVAPGREHGQSREPGPWSGSGRSRGSESRSRTHGACQTVADVGADLRGYREPDCRGTVPRVS